MPSLQTIVKCCIQDMKHTFILLKQNTATVCRQQSTTFYAIKLYSDRTLNNLENEL